MKKVTVFIVEKEAAVANLIRYRLIANPANRVQLFPTISECLLYFQKKSVPDFLVIDEELADAGPDSLLLTLGSQYPGVKIIILTRTEDPMRLSRYLENGVTDYIFKSASREIWIQELVQNLRYLSRISEGSVHT